MALASIVDDVLGGDLPLAVEAYDGSRAGPAGAPATVVVTSPDALRRIITAPGELGIARAYVSGELELKGSIWALLDLRDRLPNVRLEPKALLRLIRELGGWRKVGPVPPPPEEARLRGRRHSKVRDAAAISHHYDVSNAFYRLVLGPSLTY